MQTGQKKSLPSAGETLNTYFVKRSFVPPITPGTSLPRWNGAAWKGANVLDVSHYLPQSSDHRPVTQVKLLHDDASVYVLFRVIDRYVRAVRTAYQSDVWNDSCVEWFVRPKPGKGYFNFEINCIGTLHVHYVEDPARVNGTLKKSTPVPEETARLLVIQTSVTSVVDPEIPGPLEWYAGLTAPLSFFEPFVGPIGIMAGQTWRANFNKCGDQTSHPTWATWNPVSEPNFHRPDEFGEISFE